MMSSKWLGRACSSLAFGAFAFASTVPPAAAWEVVPDLSLRVHARDNPRLNVDGVVGAEDDDSATSMQFNGRFAFANVSPRSELFVEPRIRTDAYADRADEELESDDLFLDVRGERRWQRTTAGLRGYFSQESILYSELVEAAPLDPNVEDPIAVDTGRLVRFDQDRDRVTLAPYIAVQISARSRLLLDARHLDISYSGPAVGGRSDITDNLFSLGIERRIDERNRATARLFASRFEADANFNDTDTIGVEGSFARVISDVWTFLLSTGLRRSDIEFRNNAGVFEDDVDTNFALSLGFRKRSDRSTLNLDIQRLIDPNSSGYLEQRDEFRIALRRQMSPTLTGGVALRLIESGALGGVFSTKRDYARINLSLEWALTASWALGVSYDSIYQKFDGQADDATSNGISVGVNYRGLSRTRN